MDILRDVLDASLGPVVLSEKKVILKVTWSFEIK